jgi:hypothetical protein
MHSLASSKGSKYYDLQMAIVTSNLEKIREILDKIRDEDGHEVLINIRFLGRATPISFAVYRGRQEVLDVLLEYPFDLNKLSCDHLGRIEPPLTSAVRLGRMGIIESLLRSRDVKGAHDILINQIDYFHQTPLWTAVKFRRLDIVTLLASHPHFRTNHPSFIHSKSSPLFLASKYVNRGRHEIFTLLLRIGLPFECREADGVDEIEETYMGIKILSNNPDRAGFSIFIEIALVHSRFDLLEQCLNAGMKISGFKDLFVNSCLREAITSMTPRTLFSEARLLIRNVLTLKTHKPLTVNLVNEHFPQLPYHVQLRLTQLI